MNWKTIESTRIPPELSKRIKLTKEQKESIKREYETTEQSYNELARKYNVSKRTIMFAVNPEKYEIAKKARRARWAEGKYRELYNKEEHRKAIADLRKRKKLFLNTIK